MSAHVRSAVAQVFTSLLVLGMLQGCGGGDSKTGKTPTMSSVAPSTGTVGTIVAISGSSFEQDASGAVNPRVTFTPAAGGASLDAVVRTVSATTVEAIVPAFGGDLAAADVAFDVTVTNPGGRDAVLRHAFTMKAPTVTDINGGLSGSGTVNSLFILDGEAFGDLTAAAPGYSVDFRDPAGAVVASATVNAAAGDWQNIFVVGTVPGTLVAGTTYKVTVTTPSGTSQPANFLVQPSVSFSPSTIQWTASTALPVAQQGFPTVLLATDTATYVYAVGGNTASASTSNGKASNVATVFLNQMNATTGAIGGSSWTSATPLPQPRGFAAAVAANRFNSRVAGTGNVYVLGGLDAGGNATSTVYYASVNADGSIPAAAASGTWATTTPLPQALFAHGAVLFHGHIYVVGGNDATGTPVSTVYFAKIEADGTLGTWEQLAAIPVALAYHQLVTSAGSLYVLGGDTAAGVDPISNVQNASSQGAIYASQINIRNGQLASDTWRTNASSLGKNREKFSAVVAGSYVLVSGGLYNGASTGSSEQSYAQILTDGSIASFGGATGTHTIAGSSGGYDVYNHSATYFVDTAGTPHVLILGGADVSSGTPRAGVWYQH